MGYCDFRGADRGARDRLANNNKRTSKTYDVQWRQLRNDETVLRHGRVAIEPVTCGSPDTEFLWEKVITNYIPGVANRRTAVRTEP